jgi:hypothetical protein
VSIDAENFGGVGHMHVNLADKILLMEKNLAVLAGIAALGISL